MCFGFDIVTQIKPLPSLSQRFLSRKITLACGMAVKPTHNSRSEAETDCRRQPAGRLKGVNHTIKKELLFVGLDVHAKSITIAVGGVIEVGAEFRRRGGRGVGRGRVRWLGARRSRPF